MQAISKKQKTAVLFVVWILLLIGAWFVAPFLLEDVVKGKMYITHIAIPPRISSKELEQNKSDIKDTQKRIAQAKLKGATDQVFDLYLHMATALEALGQNAKAYQYVEALLAHDQKNKEAVFHKALLSESLAVISDATTAWRTAIELDPQNSASYQHLADITELQAHDPQATNGIYVEGLVRAGNAPPLMRTYAQFLERQGQKSTALLYWKALVGKDSKDEDAQNHVRALE